MKISEAVEHLKNGTGGYEPLKVAIKSLEKLEKIEQI